MLRTKDGSTGRLLQLCAGYFVFYVITGVTVKYFLGPLDRGLPQLKGIEFLVYSTAGGMMVGTTVVLVLRWYRLKSNRTFELGGRQVPVELLYIIPSGICTAVVIPTTTLMYTLPISVMVAMVIMRGSVIVISRIVDALQIRSGILDKKVYWQENVAVCFAIGAVAVHLVYASFVASGKGNFDFVGNAAAMTILSSYIAAYAIRIYIMNYYKNTRPKGAKSDNRGFFAVEQLSAVVALLFISVFIYFAPSLFGVTGERIELFIGAIDRPRPEWASAIVAGMAFGVVAFFSVFIFMYKGRTATFAGLVNRLTSLIAGTVATLIFAVAYGGKMPKVQDWVSLGFIFVAVAFLSQAEKRRSAELILTHEVEDDAAPSTLAAPEKA
ncbi:MAG: hypothetical protein RMA76_34950 [Deltaproteobacteria bacterium]|jgi:hypothetical protein